MPTLYDIQPVKTYISRENVIKAVEKKVKDPALRYMIMTHTDGRFFPVFIGMNSVQSGIHFHFNVVA